MKYIKQYENKKDPHKGDYVIMRTDLVDNNLQIYLNNTIGQITSIRSYDDICVKYYNVPENLKIWFRTYNRNGTIIYYTHDTINDIVVFSKNKEEIELKLAAKKYNI